MSVSSKIILTLLPVGLAASTATGYLLHRGQADLAALRGQIAVVELGVRQERRARDVTVAELRRTTEALGRIRAREPAGLPHPWLTRTRLLRDLLEKLPEERAPEISLLSPLDWLQAARSAQFDSADHALAALEKLRATACQRLGSCLSAALREYVDSSRGELPADARQLAPYLPATIDAAVLDRFAMLRSGRVGDDDEPVITAKMPAEHILTVGLSTQSVSRSASSSIDVPLDATRQTKIDRTLGAAVSALADIGLDDLDNETFDPLPDLIEAAFSEQFARAFAQAFDSLGAEAFANEVKAAVRRFAAAQGGASPANLADLRDYLHDPAKVVAAFRPALAIAQYMQTHGGRGPSDPSQWQPLLERPLNIADALSALKLQVAEDDFTITCAVGPDAVK